MLNLVEGAMKFSHDPPRTCEGVRELVDLPARCIGTNSPTCVKNIAYRIDFGIGPTRINKLSMIGRCSLTSKLATLQRAKRHLVRSRE